jgi:adenylyltransferase/sulfurtransferase
MSFRTLQLRRDENCPSCGTSRSNELIDYDRVCAPADVSAAIRSIAPRELAKRLERGQNIDVVDVREEYEWNIGRIPGARLVPLGEIARELDTFDPKRETVLYCKSGVRSLDAAKRLVAAGVSNVANLSGGIVRWREEVDPDLAQY